MSTDTPHDAFAAALAAKFASKMDDLHTTIPGRIQDYDASQQRATVQPLIKRVYKDERQRLRSKSMPPCTDVPVEFFGGGDYALTFPVARGMTCRLVFASTAIDRWLAIGGEVDPEDQRRHTLSDAVCVMGLRDFAHALKNLPSNAWVMAAPSGAEIRLGSVSASQPAMMATAWQLAHDNLINAIVGVVNGIVPSSGTPITSALAVFNAALWRSTKVRLE